MNSRPTRLGGDQAEHHVGGPWELQRVPQVVDESGVRDRHRCLLAERCQRRQLVVAERPHLETEHVQRPDVVAIATHDGEAVAADVGHGGHLPPERPERRGRCGEVIDAARIADDLEQFAWIASVGRKARADLPLHRRAVRRHPPPTSHLQDDAAGVATGEFRSRRQNPVQHGREIPVVAVVIRRSVSVVAVCNARAAASCASMPPAMAAPQRTLE